MKKRFKSFALILSIVILFSGCSANVEIKENQKEVELESIEEPVDDSIEVEESEEEIKELDEENSQKDIQKIEDNKTEEVKENQTLVTKTKDVKNNEVVSNQKTESTISEVKPKEAPKIEEPKIEQIKAQESPPEVVIPRGKFKDGTHNGSGSGNEGDIKVRVKVENGYITGIDILSHEDTKNIAENAFNTLRTNMINNQSTDVNVVSGATYSSKGFIEGVKKALN